MSHHPLRADNLCQNCGQKVNVRYCSECGQENVETRQSFIHLFRHFAEDFTHYEGNFWKTIKYLVFQPAYLTQTYLAGQRMRFVAPVKLYIFVSFMAFLLLHLLPDFNKSILKNDVHSRWFSSKAISADPEIVLENNLHSYDSLQNSLNEEDRDNLLLSKINKNMITINSLPGEKIGDEFSEKLEKITPKALFVFMPLFAFILWLFHDKKKYYYFDHGIFTLHFFCFILVVTTVNFFLTNIFPWSRVLNSNIITHLLDILSFSCILYYFFRAHYKLYPLPRGSNLLRATSFMVIVLTLLSILFLTLLMYTLSAL